MRAGHRLAERKFHARDFFLEYWKSVQGRGEHLAFVRHDFDQYVLADLDQRTLDVAKGKFEGKYGNKLAFETQSAAALRFPDNNFDRLIATHVLEHIYEPHLVLKEWKRVVKNGGMLSILIPTDPGAAWRLGRHFGPRKNAIKKGIAYDYVLAIDELAHATRQDPLVLRRKLLTNNPKALAVLNTAAEKAGWDKPAPKGVFRGLAQTHGFASFVAACAEVSVSDDGVLKIHRIVAATDPGYAVNPQQIEAQVEGSFVYGLSAALYGECTVKDGRIEQSNFHNYQTLLLAEMPKVETHIVASGGFWGGVGEPTIAVAAPAVLNAIFAATGKRIRDLPLKNHNLKRA